MKTIYLPKFILFLLFFQGMAFIVSAQSWTVQQAWIPAYIHAKQVQQEDELISKTTSKDAAEFYWNPLLLNGKLLDYNKFTVSSNGTLSVVRGNPENPQAEKIPFTVMLRREGKIVKTINYSENGIYEIDLEKVLATAKYGDQLIIEPVNPKDWKAKRILKLIGGC